MRGSAPATRTSVVVRPDVLRSAARCLPASPVRDRMARDLYELARRDGNEISRLALLTSVLELAGEPWHGQLRQEALASARALGYGTLGAGRTLAGVAPYLPAADRDELLDRAFQMARPMQRSEAMLELVPLLPVPAQPRALAEALATARARRNTSDPRRPVGVALPPLAHLPRNALHELWACLLYTSPSPRD